MPFYNKQSLLNELSAIKILNEAFSKIKTGDSMPSIGTPNNSFFFLIDLLKSLVGFEQIKNETINFLTYNILPFENLIKDLLKKLLKNTFSCSIDGKLPNFLFTDGIKIPIKQIDFFDLFKIAPTSEVGKLLYGSSQEDLNYFLYNVIQGTSGYWKDIVYVEYLPSGIVDGQFVTNILLVKIHPSYQNKTVNTFINEFIDSITILNLPLLINRIFDNIYGTISLKTGKSFEQINKENELSILIEKIINLPDTVIDESYYQFTKAEIDYINQLNTFKIRGTTKFNSCYEVISEINVEDLEDLTETLEGQSSLIEIKNIIENKFNIISIQATNDVNDIDKNNTVLEFYTNFFKGIIYGIVQIFLSPKMMFLFLTYFKIMKLTSSFKDVKEFLNENRQFVISLVRNIILPIIINFLLKLVLKYVKKLIVEENINKNIEKVKYYQLQILSLIGIPDRIINLIINRI